MTETLGGDRALPDVPETTLTCAQVEAGDVEARYLASRLGPGEAAAYEAHYFGCDRCWTALRRATEARAAFASTEAPRRGVRWARWALPAAAVLAAIGVWQLTNPSPVVPPVAMRGAADSLPLTIESGADSVHAIWRRRADADAYRVRGFTADGSLMWSIETADTALVAPRGGAVRVDAAALDRARTVIVQSALVRVGPP